MDNLECRKYSNLLFSPCLYLKYPDMLDCFSDGRVLLFDSLVFTVLMEAGAGMRCSSLEGVKLIR